MPTRSSNPLQGRLRLGQEIALALAFKVVLLAALWFVVFRPDPTIPEPSAADLFARNPIPSDHQENNHHVR